MLDAGDAADDEESTMRITTLLVYSKLAKPGDLSPELAAKAALAAPARNFQSPD